MGDFLMPSLGAGMDVGRVLEWYVGPGDQVHRGDVVALVETDKAAIEVEVFEDGVVESLVVAEGTKVPVGTVLATLGAPGSTPVTAAPSTAAEPPVPAAAAAPPGPPAPATPAAHAPPAARRAATPSASEAATVELAVPAPAVPAGPPRARSSPYARRLADERGVDLAGVRGTGPGGAVVAADLGASPVTPTPAAPATPATGEGPRATAEPDRAVAMRQAIARAMAQSKREIPHYYLGQVVDVEGALRRLEERNTDRPASERILPGALVLAATARACRDHPELNGFWVDDGFCPGAGVHLGVAISLRGGGLVAPAIHDADTLSLEELMAALNDLVRRARAGTLRGSEVSDPTITVTSLGDRGVESVYGIIYPPQVALVGAGRVQSRPWPVDGEVVVRRTIQLTLAADHRASDGHRGGLFLDAVARHLHEPEAP